jgi:hypothetical protein
MSNKRSKLYAAPGHPAPLTIVQIAALAACKYSWAHQHVASGRHIAGHVWTPTGEKTPFAEKVRRPSLVTLTAEGDPTPRTYAELQAMGGFRNSRTVYIYVSKGTPICGRVYRTEKQSTRGAGGGRPCGEWRKSREAAAPAPAAEPRRFRMAHETVDDILPVNAARILPRLDSGAAKGVTA